MFPLNYFCSESKPSSSTKKTEIPSKETFSVSKDQSEISENKINDIER